MNPRPLSPEPSTLPTALLPEKKAHPSEWALAGATGLEPAIFGLTGRRDNQLRYAPVMFKNIPHDGICVKMFFEKQIFSQLFSLAFIFGLLYHILSCRNGEIGRHKGLKIPRNLYFRVGSTPTPGTTCKTALAVSFHF